MINIYASVIADITVCLFHSMCSKEIQLLAVAS